MPWTKRDRSEYFLQRRLELQKSHRCLRCKKPLPPSYVGTYCPDCCEARSEENARYYLAKKRKERSIS